jgi:hypothetical protein
MSDFDVQDVRDLVAKQSQESPKSLLRGMKPPMDRDDISLLMHLKDAKEQRQRLGLPPQPGPSNAAGGAAGEHRHIFNQNSSQTAYATGAPPPPPPAAV